MSIIVPLRPRCPSCGELTDLGLAQSVNADRRPDIRQGILDGSFQRERCSGCGVSLRPEPEFTYLDVERGQWIAVEPVDHLDRWSALEEKAKATWERAFGASSGAASQALGRGLKARVTFGWPAVAEKLLCGEHGLDDVSLELLKLAILRQGGDVPMSDTVELRLGRVLGDVLLLGWIDGATERAVETIEVPRDLLDDFTGPAWAELRAELSAGLYVDMNRLLAGA